MRRLENSGYRRCCRQELTISTKVLYSAFVMHIFSHTMSHFLTGLFFVGAVGSIATVILFAIELVRIARNKDKDDETQAISGEDHLAEAD